MCCLLQQSGPTIILHHDEGVHTVFNLYFLASVGMLGVMATLYCCYRYSGQWTVDSIQYTVHNKQYTVDSGQWTVYSGQWTVDSRQWTVYSG